MRKSKPIVTLIPWDPESPAHIERLFQQRIACRWNSEKVESWRDLQRTGKMTLQFVVRITYDSILVSILDNFRINKCNTQGLSPADSLTPTRLAAHTLAYPSEELPIRDTACSFAGKPRIADPDNQFIPVGHISLDSTTDDPTNCDTYMISSFYISFALQGNGLGGAAMDAIESMATDEALNAKTLVLVTSANENYALGPKWVALGRDPPTVSFLFLHSNTIASALPSFNDPWKW